MDLVERVGALAALEPGPVTLHGSLDVIDGAGSAAAELQQLLASNPGAGGPLVGEGQAAGDGARSGAATLLAAVSSASAGLRAIAEADQESGLDKEEEKRLMLALAKVRVASIVCLTLLASSEPRVLFLVGIGAPRVVVEDVLACPSTNFDVAALVAGGSFARNLCMPAHLTGEAMIEAGAVDALVMAASGKARDQNGAAAAAAALRLLVEKLPASSTSAPRALTSQALDKVLSMSLVHTHPFVRVELARFLALLLPRVVNDVLQPGEAPPAPSDEVTGDKVAPRTDQVLLLRRLAEKRGVEFIGFLFASDFPALHDQAALALLSLRSFLQQSEEHGPSEECAPAQSASLGASSSEGQAASAEPLALVDPLDVGALVGESKTLADRLEELTQSPGALPSLSRLLQRGEEAGGSSSTAAASV